MYFELENKIVVSQTTLYATFKGSKTLGMLTRPKIENRPNLKEKIENLKKKINEEILRKSI